MFRLWFSEIIKLGLDGSFFTRHEEQTWSMERTESMNSDCQSGGLSSSVGTSKCSSPACMARRAAHWGCADTPGPGMQYGDSYDSLRDSPHSDRYVSFILTLWLLLPTILCSLASPCGSVWAALSWNQGVLWTERRNRNYFIFVFCFSNNSNNKGFIFFY